MICASCGEDLGHEASICPRCQGPCLLEGRYRLEEVVGHGAAGTTYRATRLSDGASFAIKEMPYRRVDAMKTVELFEREALVLEQLDHPGIPRFVEHFVAGQGRAQALFLVQEFVIGQTLAQEMEQRRHDEAGLLEIADGLLEILGYLHGLRPPVIHRDLKPTNIMRRAQDNSLVLIDFGAVRSTLEARGGSTVAGTFGYMAPEQMQGVATGATDIYGLGATLLALATRRDPSQLMGPDHRLRWEEHVEVGFGFRTLLRAMLQPDHRERVHDVGRLRQGVARVRSNPEWSWLGDGSQAQSPTERQQIDEMLEESRRTRAQLLTLAEDNLARMATSNHPSQYPHVASMVSQRKPIAILVVIALAAVIGVGQMFEGLMSEMDAPAAGQHAAATLPGGLAFGMSLDAAAQENPALRKEVRHDLGGHRFGWRQPVGAAVLDCQAKFDGGLREMRCHGGELRADGSGGGKALVGGVVHELRRGYGEPLRAPQPGHFAAGDRWVWALGDETLVTLELVESTPSWLRPKLRFERP